MRLHLGDVQNRSNNKTAAIICENHKPEIFGVIGGIIITLISRYMYKAGVEDSMDAENRALADINCMSYDPKTDHFCAKVLK
jgi:hypothetical protein